MEVCGENNWELHDFKEIFEKVRQIKLVLKKSDLSEAYQMRQSRDEVVYKLYFSAYHKKCYHHWRPEDIRRVGLDKGMFKGFNTGGMLWGIQGSGKS